MIGTPAAAAATRRKEFARRSGMGNCLRGHHHDRAGALRLRAGRNGQRRFGIGRGAADDECNFAAGFVGDEIGQGEALIRSQRVVLAGDAGKHDAVGARIDHVTRDRRKPGLVG